MTTKPARPHYQVIAESNYILLPDNKVARLLTPTIRAGKTSYNLFLPDYTRLSLDDIDATINAGVVNRFSSDR